MISHLRGKLVHKDPMGVVVTPIVCLMSQIRRAAPP